LAVHHCAPLLDERANPRGGKGDARRLIRGYPCGFLMRANARMSVEPLRRGRSPTYCHQNGISLPPLSRRSAVRIQRRKFLETAATGTAGVLAGSSLAKATPADGNPTAVVPLGKHLRASRIGLGTGMRGWMRESNQTRLGEKDFQYLLHYCYDHGVRYFDSADLYGTHDDLARAFGKKPRDSYFVTSKIWWRPRGIPELERLDADVLVRRFLKELQSDYIDMVHLHCLTDADWPRKLRKQMDLLDECKHQGLIRAHGVSCHSLDALRTAAKEPWVDAINARVNPFGAKTDAPMDEVVPVLREAHAAGKGIVGMKLCGEGTFDEQQRKESLRFVMDLGVVDVMIVGFEKPEEVDAMLEGVRANLR
jgi:hypothetical protein